MDIEVPVVVRIDGTEADEGRRLLAEAAPPNVHVEATRCSRAARRVATTASELRAGS